MDIYDANQYIGRKINGLFYERFYKNGDPWNNKQNYVLEIAKDDSSFKSYDLFVDVDIESKKLIYVTLEKYTNTYGFIPSVINGKKVKSLKRYAYEILEQCLEK